MSINQFQEAILRAKRQRDICILAHSYQAREIVEIADFTGDSYQLSVQAAKAPQKNVLMCGVRFMAETVKILSPDKTVWLSHPDAGCPMAEQMDRDLIAGVKKLNPHHTVVAYINTTADLKTICDVCVTSSSAVKIISRIENDKILFIPDCNLGAYVASQLPDKQVKLLQGGCPIHAAARPRDAEKAIAAHPGAKFLVHPECDPKVVAMADFVGSTSAIMDYAKRSDAQEFIIGTELSIAWHLQYDCPGKRFWPLTKNLVCPNMRLTSLADVYRCVVEGGGTPIELDADTISKARVCIDKMIELGE
ncbi:quinolinate synthase A [Clostridia bacterium]|nr:quinolinate synthase A [Clostridia bacterium]